MVKSQSLAPIYNFSRKPCEPDLTNNNLTSNYYKRHTYAHYHTITRERAMHGNQYTADEFNHITIVRALTYLEENV